MLRRSERIRRTWKGNEAGADNSAFLFGKMQTERAGAPEEEEKRRFDKNLYLYR